MPRKEIRKLFQDLQSSLPQDVTSAERTIVWRFEQIRQGRFLFKSEGFSQDIGVDLASDYVTNQILGSFLVDDLEVEKVYAARGSLSHSFGKLHDLGLPLGMGNQWRSIGRGDNCQAIMSKNSIGHGEFRSASQSFYSVKPNGAHSAMFLDKKMIAKQMVAWKESETAQGISSRIWLDPTIPESEAILIATLFQMMRMPLSTGD